MILKRNFFALLVFTHALLFAQTVVTSKKISEGQQISYYPKQGESFRVSIDLDNFVVSANYDIVMRNGKIIYFENKNQKDDIYFVFNEPVDRGDEILLKVNRGYFIYTSQSVEDLPKPIKKVLQVNEKERKAKKALDTKDEKVTIKTKEYCFDDNGDVYECEAPSSTVQKSTTFQKGDEETSKTPNFIELFSKKLQMAYEKIKTSLISHPDKDIKNTEEKIKPEIKKELVQKEEVVNNKTEKKSLNEVKNIVKTPPKELPQENTLISKKVQLPQPKSVKPPLLPLDSVAIVTSVSKPQIKSPSFISKIAQNSSNRQGAEVVKPNFSDNLAKNLPKVLKESSSKSIKQEYRPKIKEPQRISPLDNLNTPVAQPVYKEAPTQQILQRRLKESEISIPKITPSIMQTQKIQPPQISQKVNKPVISKPVEVKNAEVIAQNIQKPTQTQIIEVKKPQQVTEEEIIDEEDDSKDRIVITKIIEKKPSSTTPAGKFPERMSDRVLGGGYKETNGMGSVSVKAYSNSKPVSAWVEVYQNKKRVKSFYTGRSKAVKLPAGTYVLKATYRTGTSKQKKVLGKIKLAEGQSIRKKVHFKIGTLNVIAKRGDKPLYVKVEIYKKGSASRYAYTFSSRNTGIAHLKLSEGTYKIVVRDRGRTKTLNNIFIKGAALKSVLAEF